MLSLLRPAIVLFVLLTLIVGIAYPLAATGVAQFVFAHQANGSLLHDHDQLIGSELIGQAFSEPRYFWSRPSACSYATLPSGASNWGPTSDTLRKTIEKRRESFIIANRLPLNTVVPNEMVTASGSGLDPHISPAAAYYQVPRVAKATGLDPNQVRKLVEQHVKGRQFGVLGEERVNVLALNLALDALAGKKKN